MSQVMVLMSTWNGVRFLEAQLQSIFSQSFDGNIHVLVRDDGSSDGTLELLNRYRGPCITVVRGKNLGAKASFLELLRLARRFDVDYYALADQDDVWATDKIARAVSCIGDTVRPTLYCSSVELVDQDLSHLSIYVHPGDRSFASTLLRNYATGCTCVFNKSLLERIRFPSNSNHIMMHDWWLGVLASASGGVFYDIHPHIMYRQHGGNHIGMLRGVRGVMRGVIRSLRAQKVPSRVTQAESFQEAYASQLSEATKGTLCRFLKDSATPWGRMRFVWSERAHVGVVAAVRFILLA